VHFDVAQVQLDGGLAQKGGFFLIRLGERDLPFRLCDRQRNARQPRARARVANSSASGAECQMRHHRQ
jgi:hypothetical protein